MEIVSRAAMAVEVVEARQANEKALMLFVAQKARKSEKTATSYAKTLRVFLDWLGDRTLDTLDLTTLSAYVDTLAHLALATQARITTTIRSFFKFLAKDGVNVLRVNPAAALELPEVEKEEDSAVERVLTEAEAQTFIDALRPVGLYRVSPTDLPFSKFRNFVAFATILTTGVRISELCGARWRDVYEDNAGNVGLRTHGKGNRKRIVKLRPDVWKFLRDLRKCAGLAFDIDPTDETPLFTNKDGDACTDRYFRKVAKETAQRAGIKKPVSPHWFRHTFATLALEGGADVEKVRRQLGHSSLQHTTRYLHNTKGLRDTAADYVEMTF